MSGGRLDRICCYPVKGFGPQELTEATMRPGHGVPNDRRWGLANGREPIGENGAWTPATAFVRLTKNGDLPLYPVEFDGTEPKLTYPGGRLVEAANSYLDHEYAHLSLINLETLAELEEQAGVALDPIRFRANLYVSGLPAWQEFALVGSRVRIGEVELEIIRPIDRCKATSVDPVTAEADVQVPALLGKDFGHVYCGVYARVVTGGRLVTGQPLSRTNMSAPIVPGSWPRTVQVIKRVAESATVTSIWLRDPTSTVLPGQHIRVHTRDEHGPLWRSYTVSAVEGDELRISVKREQHGRMSVLLHENLPEGADLLITGPFGEMVLDEQSDDRPLLMVSAGIGITPMVAMLRACVDNGTTRPVTVLHAARDAQVLALWDEALDLVRRLPDARAQLFLSRPNPGDCAAVGATPGRLVLDSAALDQVSAFVCGPADFLRQVRESLVGAGVADADIQYEVFASPKGNAGAVTPPPAPGPFRVRFHTSEVEAEWRADVGSLLDLAEAAGLSPAVGCRAGACRTCALPFSTGTVAYTTEPVIEPPRDSVLVCCAVPTSDVTILG